MSDDIEHIGPRMLALLTWARDQLALAALANPADLHVLAVRAGLALAAERGHLTADDEAVIAVITPRPEKEAL